MLEHIRARTAEETKNFYDGIVAGRISRRLWGKHQRFDPAAIADKPSVQRHFVRTMQRYLTREDLVLDIGCGPGGFMIAMAGLCDQIIGADITPSFVELSNKSLAERQIGNAKAELIGPGKLPYADAMFDKIVMVDTIHHLDNVRETMNEVCRVLKPGGLLLIFEPNKRNPALWMMCFLDSNEHGLLRLGTAKKYRALLGGRYDVLEDRYSGLLIGPDGNLSRIVADAVSEGILTSALGWLSPKLFIAARKRS